MEYVTHIVALEVQVARQKEETLEACSRATSFAWSLHATSQVSSTQSIGRPPYEGGDA